MAMHPLQYYIHIHTGYHMCRVFNEIGSILKWQLPIVIVLKVPNYFNCDSELTSELNQEIRSSPSETLPAHCDRPTCFDLTLG